MENSLQNLVNVVKNALRQLIVAYLLKRNSDRSIVFTLLVGGGFNSQDPGGSSAVKSTSSVAENCMRTSLQVQSNIIFRSLQYPKNWASKPKRFALPILAWFLSFTGDILHLNNETVSFKTAV